MARSSIIARTSEVVPSEQVGDVAVVRVTMMTCSPAVEPAGVRFVAGVDDRPLQGRLEPDLDLEEVAALADLEPRRPVLPDSDAPRAAHHLARHEERDEVADDVAERRLPAHQVVLVGAVGGTLAVGVVLVQVHARGHLREAAHGLPRWAPPARSQTTAARGDVTSGELYSGCAWST